MAILFTSLFFVFTILLLPKYRVNYYDYIVKWCFGIKCSWCVSLDISQMLALNQCFYQIVGLNYGMVLKANLKVVV